MTRPGRHAIALVVLWAAVSGCASGPLQNPLKVQGMATTELTRIAILRAASREDWLVDQEAPGRIRARVQGSGWFMSTDIEYGSDITIHYADSQGLGYQLRKGHPYIHGGYNSRCEDLLQAIEDEMKLMARYPEPPSAAPEGLPPVGAMPPVEHFPPRLQKDLQLKAEPAPAPAPEPPPQ